MLLAHIQLIVAKQIAAQRLWQTLQLVQLGAENIAHARWRFLVRRIMAAYSAGDEFVLLLLLLLRLDAAA